MYKFSLFVRSFIFITLFWVVTVLVGIVYAPVAFNARCAVHAGKTWGYLTKLLLKYICNIEVEYQGLDNIPKEVSIIASKHQSAVETAVFFSIFDFIVVIHKKELLWVPVFGWYLMAMRMISIERENGTKSIRKIAEATKKTFAQNRHLIIFPQGTRTKPKEKAPYKPGVALIYSANHVPVVPVALNSGLFWPKGQFIKYPGKIIVRFLPAIEPGLPKREFMEKLETAIETETAKLGA